MELETSLLTANECIEKTKTALIKKVTDQISNHANAGQFYVELYINNLIENELIEQLRQNGFHISLLAISGNLKRYKISWETTF